MTRSEFIKFKSTGTLPDGKVERNTRLSVTNPLYAQTVREMLTNPLPITPRPMNYFQGPLVKDMHAFDKMYPDKFDAFKAAKEVSDKTKSDLDELQKKYDDSKKPKNDPPKNEPVN